MKEEALRFGPTGSLIGIVTDPPEEERGKNLPAFLLLNSGIIHRVGPNRHYVTLARKLAAMGFVVLRFDFSGIGDSEVMGKVTPFEESTLNETKEAMDYLSASRGLERFVVAGICSGALVSFKGACQDPRVEGAILINPGGYTEELTSFLIERIRARRYWKTALFDPARWLRAITGRVDYRVMVSQLTDLVSSKKKVLTDVRMVAADFRSLVERNVRVLVVCSEGDPSTLVQDLILDDGMSELLSSGKLKIETVRSTDHTFMPIQKGEELHRIVQNWAHEMVYN